MVWGVNFFLTEGHVFLTEEHKEDKIKVKRYFLMAKHLFTFLPLHPFTFPTFHLFTSSPFPPFQLSRRSIFSPFYFFTCSPFPPFQLSKGHQAKGTKIAFEQCFYISCWVTAYMYSCSNLSGTVFQMMWNEVPDKLEHEYKTYVTRPLLNWCVIYS